MSKSLNILILSPIEPYPPHGGWQTVIYNDIKFLAARGHALTVLATTSNNKVDNGDLEKYCRIFCFFKKKRHRIFQVLANTGSSLPYTVKRHLNPDLLEFARNLLRKHSYDVILCEDVVMGQTALYLREEFNIPIYLRGHNISTQVCRRFYECQKNPVIRYAAYRQYEKWHCYERRMLFSFNGVSQISPVDAKAAQAIAPGVQSHVLYSGVDIEYFKPLPEQARDDRLIVHVGTLDASTKLPGMLWFYRSVLPVIKKQFPSVRLELAGFTPRCALYDADPTDVVVHGKVPDVRPYLSRGWIFIAPQFVGSGIRIKILNAMAMGNAVVATTVACEGLPVTHQENIMIADTQDRFAEVIMELLRNPEKRTRVAENARQFVVEQFGWESVAQQLENQLLRII